MSISDDMDREGFSYLYNDSHTSQENLIRESYCDDSYSCNNSPKKLKLNLGQQNLEGANENLSSKFWRVWQEYRDDLHRKCLRWMNWNVADAEDVLSQSAIKAWEKWPDYVETIRNPKAWLMRLCHNLCVDWHRERSHAALHFDNIERVAGVVQSATQHSYDVSAESKMLRKELESCIHHAISSLPTRLRDPFILYSYWGLSYAEIAQELMLSEVNVRKRVQQAREQLKPRVNQYLSGLDKTVLAIADVNDQWILKPSGTASPMEETAEAIYHYWRIATCLENLAHSWYQSPGRQEWS